MRKNIPIIIVCGGQGKRLGHISKLMPKTMVKINKKSIIKHKLDYYKKNGINKFYICLGYKGKLVKKHLNNYPANIKYSNSGIRAGILKRIHDASNLIDETAMIISYGDTLAKINLKKLYNSHLNSKALITIVVSKILNPFGIVEYNRSNQLVKFSEKPVQDHFIGYAVFSKNIFEHISKNIINMPDGDGIIKIIQEMIHKKKTNIFKFKGLQLTVNTSKDLKEANLKYNKYFTL
jgi:glucose-1-phosphate cytidylyltransferase